MNKEKIIRAIKDHIWGPVGSIVFHVLLLIILITVTANVSHQKTIDITATVMEAQVPKNMEEIKREVEKIRKIEDQQEVIEEITPPDFNDVTSAVDSPTNDGSDGGAGVGFGGGVGFGSAAGDFTGFDVASDASGPLVMRGLYEGRSSGGRGSALAKYGGRYGRQTESAVIKALEWLKNHQNPDGSWGPRKMAMTGLGLLTFLAHGETTGSKQYGHVVRKAIDYLMAHQKEDGALYESMNTSGNGGDPGSYEHGICTYAIAEAYGLCRIPELKERMEKAAGIIIKGQQPGGIWNYGFLKNERRDLSVAGWQMQALKACYINGAETSGLKEALEKAVAGTKAMQNAESGRFGYSSPGQGNDGITGVGVLCLQLLGHGKDKEVSLGLKAMADFDCKWQEPTKWPMYAWYYITQAKFQAGQGTWNTWNAKFAPEFTKNQAEDGHWESPKGKDGESEETKQGPVYSTCLAALTLQVYYRFLPTYREVKSTETEEGVDTKSDVKVEVI